MFTSNQPRRVIHIRAKQNVFPPQVTFLIHYLLHIPTVKDWTTLWKMKLNEPGKHKIDR